MFTQKSSRLIVISAILIAITAITVTAKWGSGIGLVLSTAAASEKASEPSSAMFVDTKTVCDSGTPDFPSVAAAVADANSAVPAGGRTYLVCAGLVETAPAGGYAITAASSAANPVAFVKSGAGANPTITANAALTAGNLNDAIFKIIGSDNVTIDGFTMLENAGNTTTTAASNNMTEWGVALLYATTTDGAQNCVVQNNTITLNRTYQNTFGIYSNSTHTATAVTTSASATTSTGGNSGLKVYGNSISNVNLGVVIVGPTAAADAQTGIDVGGSGGVQANSITNFGTTGTFSGYANVSGTVNGILVRNSNGFNVSFNTVTSSVGGTTVGTLNGIQIPAASSAPTTTFTNNINNNNISLQSAVAAGAINGINYPSGSASTTSVVNINNNDFNTFGHTVAASGAITFITHASTDLTQSISNNTFTNMTVNTTGSVVFIVNTNTPPAGATKNVNNNSIVTAFNKTGAGGTNLGFSDNGSDPGATNTNNCNNNNFSNMTFTGASSFTAISSTNGGAPTKNVIGNTVSNITGGTSAIVGITNTFSAGPTTVSGNTVSGITCACSISGMVDGSGVGARTVSKNKIYDLNGTAAGSVVIGESITNTTTSANVTFVNNLIGNLTAAAATGSNAVIGISITGSATTATFNVYYNTVYLNNTTSGAGFGSSGLSTLASATATTSALNLRNNVIVNTSVQNGAGLTVAYRRSVGTAGTLANYASTSNNNDFYAGTPSATNLIYSDGTSSAQTISAYKGGVFTAGTISPRDSASITENPPFLSTTGSSANFLHINTGTPTQLESGAAAIAGITDDFDGNSRNASTPDMGADEFTGTLLDLVGPSISYTALANTSLLTNRTLSATITDPSGIAGGGNAPRIYFKKSTDAGYVSTQCTGTYVCTINYALVGGGSVATGDTIQYFVVAQDTPGNLSANPSAGFAGTDVNTISSPPTTPNSYRIATPLSGSKSVCSSGCDYDSLTNTNGVFDSINNNVVTGNLTINITGDLTAETGTVALNTVAEESGSGFTITVQPSGAARIVSGSTSANAMIRTSGASRLVIDGSIGGGGSDRSLTISNTSVTTPQVVRFGNVGTTPMTGNTLKNCIVINGVNTSSAVVITDNTGAAGYWTNITIQNNDIRKAFIGVFGNAAVVAGNGSGTLYTQNKVDNTGTDSVRLVGLYMQGIDGGTISNNTVGNFDGTITENDTGIWLATGTVNTTISGNTVSGLTLPTSGSAIMMGIRESSGSAASGNNITGNTVSSLVGKATSSTLGPSVIGIENSSSGTTIQKNKVSGLNNTDTGTFGAAGIDVSAGNNTVIKNNFVSDVTGDMTGGAAFSTTFGISGIRIAAGTGHKVYNNSVNLFGARAGTATTSLLTCALGLVSTASTGMDIRNNIFANNITGGTTSIANVAVALPSGGTAAMGLLDNNNSYYYGTDAAAGAGESGTTAGSPNLGTLALLTAYTNTLGNATNDNASIASSGSVPYATSTDLHLGLGDPELNVGATVASVTDDIDGESRPQNGAYEIGADEFFAGTPTNTPTASPTFTNTSTPTQTATETQTATNTPTPGCGSGTFSYTAPVLNTVAIPDNLPAGVNVVIPVSGLGTVNDLNFRFDGTQDNLPPTTSVAGVSHSWVGDVKVTITAPGGQGSVVAFDRPGVPASTFGCSNNNIAQITLDDDGGFPAIETSCDGVGTAFPTGSFSPNNPLSAFDGINPNGDWVINFSDGGSGDTGYVNAVSLIIDGGCGTATATNTSTPTGTPSSTNTATATSTATSTATQTNTATPTATATCEPLSFNFANTAPITINDSAPGSPYPSDITVSGLTGNVYKVKVKLNGLDHTFPADIDMLLVGPGGQNAVIMSDVGGSSAVTGVSFTLDSDAAAAIPAPPVNGATYLPTNSGVAANELPAPAPASLGGSSLATFVGQPANGTWSLYVADDASGDTGSFAGGWELIIFTDAGPCATPTFTPTGTPSATNTATATATATFTPTPPAAVCDLTEGFDDVTTLVSGSGWYEQNNSQPIGFVPGWGQGNPANFPAQSGATNSYLGVNYASGGDPAPTTISNWAVTPPLTLQNGGQFTFWTRSISGSFPDRLQVRMSTNGTSTNVGTLATDVGDFTTLMLDINPTYTASGYPLVFTQYTVTISGLGSPTTGRMAFRYFVEDGGPSGSNSNYIGIDSMEYHCAVATPTATATSTATETATSTATATATATSTPGGADSVAGTITYGNPASPTTKFISNATVASTVGSPLVTTTTAAPGGTAGQYTLTGFGAGNYTVGVTKTTGQNGISSNDAARVAQHVAGTVLIVSARQRISADTTGNGGISSQDAAKIAQFVAGLPPTAPQFTNTWRFFVPSLTEPTFPIGASPTTRSYTAPIGTQTGQDYIGILIGETTGNWAAGPLRPAQGPTKSTAIAAPQLVTPADNEVLIPVAVQGAANKGIISYEFDLRYDPAVIQPQADVVDVTGTASKGLMAVANPNEPGLLRVVVYGAYPIDTNGVLMNLKFTAVGAPGTISPLTWERVMFNEGDPGTVATNGQVELSAAAPNQAELTGRVVNAMGQGIANARVTMTDTTGQTRSVMSNGFGVYRFGGLNVGQTFTITVNSKALTFTPLTVSVTGSSVNVDLIAGQ